jgi:hypothetical protein
MSHLSRFLDPAERTDPNEDLADEYVEICIQCRQPRSDSMDRLCDRCRLFAEYHELVGKE